jgi:hypothetical protein
MLFFSYFSCLIVAFTAVAMWLIGSFNNSTLPMQRRPRPPIEQTLTAEQIAPLRLQASSITNARWSSVSATTTTVMETRGAMPKRRESLKRLVSFLGYKIMDLS